LAVADTTLVFSQAHAFRQPGFAEATISLGFFKMLFNSESNSQRSDSDNQKHLHQ
jgi:hypothetical protein